MLTAARRVALGTFVLGVSESITTFEAVCLLLQYGATVHLYRDSDTLTFHPKLYVIAQEAENYAYVGSSNLTYPGWATNIELSVRLDDGSVDDLREYIAALTASAYAIRISSVEDAERARNDGLLVSERDARSRREGGGIVRKPRAPLPNAREPRRVAVDPEIQLQALRLFDQYRDRGFVLFEPTQTGEASFVTDLGLSEANRLKKILAQSSASGTFEPNIDVDRALVEHPDFWGWPDRYTPSKRGGHREFFVPVRLRTHLTPREGILTEGRLWVRRRGGDAQAEFRFRVGGVETLRTYFDRSINADALLRIDRLVEDVYDVTVLRPEDPGYDELSAIVVEAGHHKAVYL